MKFGVLQFFSWPGRRNSLEVVYERALSRVDTMDRTGYDAVWLAEHHFQHEGYECIPNILQLAVHLAHVTSKI